MVYEALNEQLNIRLASGHFSTRTLHVRFAFPSMLKSLSQPYTASLPIVTVENSTLPCGGARGLSHVTCGLKHMGSSRFVGYTAHRPNSRWS